MEIKIKEKDKIINEQKLNIQNLYNQIKINENSYKNNYQVNKISELEDEIKQLKSYILSPGEKIIFIKFISTDQKINFPIAVKTNDIFTKIENILYNKYPDYKEYDNIYLVNGNRINRNKTIEENNIKEKNVVTIATIDDIMNNLIIK